MSIVDLDTVKPGLLQYDIRDCLRSACNPLGQETEGWGAVLFGADLCEAVLRGYISQARPFLTDHDYAYMYDAVRVITFELGLRFFTDYLAGNVYFKASNPEHNLSRALVQFHAHAFGAETDRVTRESAHNRLTPMEPGDERTDENVSRFARESCLDCSDDRQQN